MNFRKEFGAALGLKKKYPLNTGKRLLNVSISEANDLLGVTNKGKSCDSCVKIELKDLGGRTVDSEADTTLVVRGTRDPKWNEEFQIGHHYSMDNAELPEIRLHLYHRSLLTSEIPLGMVTLNLMSVDSSGQDFLEIWMDLEKFGRMKEVSGRIRVRLQFNRARTGEQFDREDDISDEEGTPRPTISLTDSQGRRMSDGFGFTKADDELLDDLPPNEMNIMVIRAKNLVGMDKPVFGGPGTSDPYVKVRVYGSKGEDGTYPKHNSKVKLKDLNPVWMERFQIPLKNEGATLHFKIYDKNRATFDRFLGSVIIPVGSFRDKKLRKKYYRLMDEFGNADGVDRGDLELAIQWNVSTKVLEAENNSAAAKQTFGGRFMNILKGNAFTEDSEPEDEDDVEAGDNNFAYEDEVPPMTDEEREDQRKADEEKRELLESIQIKDGDWQMSVHLIEARELKGENYDGTSDPIVYVEAFGQKMHTAVIYGQTSVVWDEVLIFNMKGLTKEELNDASIRVSVMDWNSVSNTMIGAYAIDAASVYTSNKHHELYREWVGLIDDVEGDDIGVQGYLKLSVSLVGPDEKVYIHDLDAELAEEMKKEASCGGDLSQLILSVPTIRKEWNYVVAKIFKAEDLPIMDGKVALMSKAGTDAFCKLSFGGAPPIKTKVKTIKAETRRAVQPVFNYELWYPVSVPSMTSKVKTTVWDYDDKGSELIGVVMANMKTIRAAKYQMIPPQWYAMYGSHELKLDTAFNNLKKLGGEIKKGLKQLSGVEIDWYKFYNDVPALAPSYKGRLLTSFRIEKERPLKYQEDDIEPFRRKIKSIPFEQVPEEEEYKLKAMVISGTELPAFASLAAVTTGNLTKIGEQQRLKIKVTIGVDELCTAEAKFERGVCRWNELMESESIRLPKDLSQVPDIFVYLVTEAGRPVCFSRIKATKVLSKAQAGQSKDRLAPIGFETPASWVYMKEDKALDYLDAGEFPGSILLRVGFGTADECKKTKGVWKAALTDATRFTNYQVRVHLYQARNLPAADSDGLADSYVSVQFMGHQKCSKIVKGTLFPTWYDTIIFPDVSIAAANQFEYAPMVNFRAFDHVGPDFSNSLKVDPKIKEGLSKLKLGAAVSGLERASSAAGGVLNAGGLFDNLRPDQTQRGRPSRPGLLDKYLGMAQFPINKGRVMDYDTDTASFPRPEWINLFHEEPGDGDGAILALVQLIETNGRTIPDKIPHPIPPELSIVPKSRQAWIEMIIMGVRNLAPYHFRAMSSPYLEITLESLGNTYTSVTAPSKTPDPDNPNFLERIILPVRMPEDSIYATALNVRVRDKRLGGFLKPVVGTCAVELVSKIPWCADTYIAPATQIFTTGDDVVVETAGGHNGGKEETEQEQAEVDAWERSHGMDENGLLIINEDDEFELIQEEIDEEVPVDDEAYEAAMEAILTRVAETKAALDEGRKEDVTIDLNDPRARIPRRTVTRKRLRPKVFDKAAREARRLREERRQELLSDDYIVNPEPPALADILAQRQAEEDTGAGVFGALRHIKVKGKTTDKYAAAFTDPDWSQDDGDLPPDWSIGREKLQGDLEETLVTSPFETYDLIRGKEGVKGRLLGNTKRIVGKFKGLIRIMESEDQEPMFNEEMMEQLLKPKPYVVRLYLLRATNLVGMDLDMYGNVAKSDPYVKVQLGKFKFNDRKNAVDDMTDVDLYKMVEIDCELPGASQLNVAMMDKDHIGGDDLIGKTVIDLEDRWFDGRWQDWGEENMILPGNDAEDETRVRWKTKPIERRPLRLPASTMQQGTVECWVDIMQPAVSQSFPADKVALPPTQTFEVRLVIWKAKDVPPQDWLEGMSDLFVKAWPEGCAAQETDTHWRAKKGKASWNYRLNYDVELGHSTRAMKFPYLYIQLWDRDILKWSDCAGEVVFNLGRYYRKAFKRGIAIKLFESASGAAATRQRKGDKIKKLKVVETAADLPPPEDDAQPQNQYSSGGSTDGDGSGSGEGDDIPAQSGKASALLGGPDARGSVVVGKINYPEPDTDISGTNPLAEGVPAGAAGAAGEGDDARGRTETGLSGKTSYVVSKEEMNRQQEERFERDRLATEQQSSKPWWWFGSVPQEEDSDSDADSTADSTADTIDSDDDAAEKNPLLGAPKTAAEEEEDEEEEMKEQVDAFKNLTGIWDIDPADSDWVHLSKKDHNTDKVTPMGSLCISLQIWPKDKAIALPSGAARNDPNTNPFLPPPVGRLKWSWNPFVLGSELCGPKLCASFTCCLLVTAFIVLMIFCQPFLNIIINIIFVVFGA